MNTIYKTLGKVCLTPAGYWDRTKQYERLDIVTHPITGYTYIAKQNVQAGIYIDNENYWQKISAGGYKDNNIIILCDIDANTNTLVRYTLETAIQSININDRRPGLILGFYGTNFIDQDSKNEWFLYQFNSDNIDDWNKLECWVSIYDNINKFKGYFANDCLLINNYPHPTIGDFAFVGKDMENAILYICIENGNWKNTQTSAFCFANKYTSIYSKDVEEFKENVDETYADRSTKDALGNVIHDTYITRTGLKNAIIDAVTKAVWSTELPDGIVTMEKLSKSVINFIGSLGNIINNVDNEDVTIKNDTIKFNDKEYSETNYSGYGRTFVRKNIIDGVNTLEQSQINKTNTRYIIQYNYCLNDKNIVIPDNCILDFSAGGCFKNGIITCNNTIIFIPNIKDLDITIEGTYTIIGDNSSIINTINSLNERITNIETQLNKLYTL